MELASWTYRLTLMTRHAPTAVKDWDTCLLDQIVSNAATSLIACSATRIMPNNPLSVEMDISSTARLFAQFASTIVSSVSVPIFALHVLSGILFPRVKLKGNAFGVNLPARLVLELTITALLASMALPRKAESAKIILMSCSLSH